MRVSGIKLRRFNVARIPAALGATGGIELQCRRCGLNDWRGGDVRTLLELVHRTARHVCDETTAIDIDGPDDEVTS